MQHTQMTIELFHLLFLHQLGAKLDKNLYALKGGCNLRFFFNSIRYSEDIDFDVSTIARETLQKKVDKILQGIDFKRILQSKGIQIIQINPSKQTQTTQRWKVLLSVSDSMMPIPTKIEFSRRDMNEGMAYAAVSQDIINQHHIYPIICNHYNREAAFLQKISALIHRTETQARDIFDLKWLLDQGISDMPIRLSKQEAEIAVSNVYSMQYADFKGQVVAYLMREYVAFYDSPEKWSDIQKHVFDIFEKIIQREKNVTD